MTIHQHATLADTVYFWFGSNDTSGSGNDGAAAAADVRLAGAAAGAAPVLSPAPTLLSHANYPAGCYEVAVAATAGNGFAATNTYAVFCTLAVDGQNPTGFVGSFTLDPIISNVKEISDDSTAADNLELDYDGTGYAKANSTIGTTTTNTDLVTAAAVVNEWETQSQADPTGFHVNVLEIGGTAQTANDNGADINAILVDTAEIGVAGAGLTDLGGMSAGMKAEVESEANDALVAQKLDHLVAVADADDPVDDSIIAKMAASDNDWSGFDPATDSLEAIRDKQTDIETDTAEIGVAGAGLTNINLPNQTMDIIGNITGNLSGSVGSVTGAVGSVTGAVGSVTGAVGSVTGNVGGNVVGSVASVTARVTANTDQIEGVDATDQIRDSILDDATRFSGADIDAAITTRATPAQVNAEVVDGLATDTYAEPPQGAPAATTTIERKIAYIYKFARNEIRQTAAQLSVYNDAGAVVDQKAATSDDGVTYTRGEMASGP